MPEYLVVTEQVIQRTYKHKIDLPIDMGASTERITDRMMRTAAAEGALVPFVSDEALDTIETIEKTVSVVRGDEQIWPRKHKSRKKELTIADVGHPVFTKPEEEDDE